MSTVGACGPPGGLPTSTPMRLLSGQGAGSRSANSDLSHAASIESQGPFRNTDSRSNGPLQRPRHLPYFVCVVPRLPRGLVVPICQGKQVMHVPSRRWTSGQEPAESR